ncbi:MAG: hypothetical protein E4G90_11895, partial [Gemmatimonadales bacterium]
MKDLLAQGRTALYNGTYSQPHLQTLGSESNYRQFEYGMKVYRELLGHPPVVYAHQEASVHDQVPQLLCQHGITYAVIPGFSSTIEWLGGGSVAIRWGEGPTFTQGSEFVHWVGLDGTEVPLYLSVPNRPTTVENAVAVERISGFLGMPPLMVQVPDLIEVNDEFLEAVKDVDLVLLGEALDARMIASPPSGRVRFHSNWSYIEGIQAESLSRANAHAERALLQREALSVISLGHANARPGQLDQSVMDERWKLLLACQHHDVYCFCGPEIKAKAVGWLTELAAEVDAEILRISAEILEVSAEPSGGEPSTGEGENHGATIALFSGIACGAQSPVEVQVNAPFGTLAGPDGTLVPFDLVSLGDGGHLIRFVGETAGVGYSGYTCGSGTHPLVLVKSLTEPYDFESQTYTATISVDGHVTSLRLKTDGRELIQPGSPGGN